MDAVIDGLDAKVQHHKVLWKPKRKGRELNALSRRELSTCVPIQSLQTCSVVRAKPCSNQNECFNSLFSGASRAQYR